MKNPSESSASLQNLVCPLPLTHESRIVMGHGSGGTMTQNLIDRVFQKYLNSAPLAAGDDFAQLSLNGSRLAISTDSHIVKPLFFPGGDIGRLAVCGTVNDVAMSGAVPLALTAGFILEEGLEVAVLERILASMKTAASEAGVEFIAGDTKVVEKGFCDGMYINTTGIGVIPTPVQISGANAKPGDAVLLSGTLADHGIAVVSARGELGLESEVRSDTAPLNKVVEELVRGLPEIHVLRDPTRGGLATTLNEIARQSQVAIRIEESLIPVNPVVAAACEMLGFDPLYVANEGKMILILPAEHAEQALAILHRHPVARQAVRIGTVEPVPAGRVLMRTLIGANRIVDRLTGEILPRIC